MTYTISPKADLHQAVFESLGAASVCWIPRPTGEFDSERAKEIGDELVRWIQDTIEDIVIGAPSGSGR